MLLSMVSLPGKGGETVFMVQEFLLCFFVTAVSFFLFYFNAPYWTGKGMLDVAKNGVYRFIYTVASTLGFWLG